MKKYPVENSPIYYGTTQQGSQCRCLVINPPNKPFSSKHLLIEPIDILGLATFIRELGNTVQLVDMDHLQVDASFIVDVLKEFSPEWTIIPFDYHIPLYTSEAISNVVAIAQCAIASGSRVLIGGRPATFHPEAFKEIPNVLIAQGEMEPVIAELLKQKGSHNQDSKQLLGVMYFEGGVLHKNARPVSFDIEQLPIPDRSLINISEYIDVHTILSSRGCVEKCAFCPVPAFWGRWRKRSALQVVDEIEYLVNTYQAKKILFLDDHATVDKRRMQEISREVLKRKLSVTLGCLGTIVSYDQETFLLMYEAGFRWVHYGAEFADNAVLRNLKKRHTVSQLEEVLAATMAIGFRVRSSWILDAPSANDDGVRNTVEAIIKNRTHEVRAHFFAPRAGAALAQGYVAEPESGVPPQYLHSGTPLVINERISQKVLAAEVGRLTTELSRDSYAVVRDPHDWKNFENLISGADQRFISFCPGRYGIGWRK
jgi:anaerobic magnesium-protoporphyrin IX monomethyl ester cyclase